MKRTPTSAPSPTIFALALFLTPLACTLPTESPPRETGGTLPPDDSSVPATDDSSSDDSSTHVDDSAAPDDSSVTSGDIEWTLIDSTNGPVTHDWASCGDREKCDYAGYSDHPELCGGVTVGIARSQDALNTLYAESLGSIDYVPKIDFSSHLVGFSYLCCCTPTAEWIVVDDMTRVGTTLSFSMHIESSKLGPATFGRPWVVVQVPIGDYNDVTHNLDD